jgi:hypothetical protein
MKKNKFFDDLKEGLQSATQFEKGKLDLRTTEMKSPRLSPERVWEQENKKTSRTARRLLQLVREKS